MVATPPKNGGVKAWFPGDTAWVKTRPSGRQSRGVPGMRVIILGNRNWSNLNSLQCFVIRSWTRPTAPRWLWRKPGFYFWQLIYAVQHSLAIRWNMLKPTQWEDASRQKRLSLPPVQSFWLQSSCSRHYQKNIRDLLMECQIRCSYFRHIRKQMECSLTMVDPELSTVLAAGLFSLYFEIRGSAWPSASLSFWTMPLGANILGCLRKNWPENTLKDSNVPLPWWTSITIYIYSTLGLEVMIKPFLAVSTARVQGSSWDNNDVIRSWNLTIGCNCCDLSQVDTVVEHQFSCSYSLRQTQYVSLTNVIVPNVIVLEHVFKSC